MNCESPETGNYLTGPTLRTHHWSPLNKEVDFITTPRDHELASFDCAKDRHIFPWVDVNARFGFIKYAKKEDGIIEHL